MNKRTVQKPVTVAAAALLICLILLPGLPSGANSAQTEWRGTTASGVLVTDENCPVEVKNEQLTFHIEELPGRFDFKIEDYRAYVTADYTFYNPADYTVTATLAFPFGRMPEYSNIMNENDQAVNRARYGATIDGKPVETAVRHTLSLSAYDNSADIPKLKNGYTDDPFFRPELPVRHLCFSVERQEKDEQIYAVLEIRQGSGMKIASGGYGFVEVGSGTELWFKGDEYSFWAFGDLKEEGYEWRLYKDADHKEKIERAVIAYGEKTEQTTYEEFVFSSYREENGIGRVDWYNAFTDFLNENSYGQDKNAIYMHGQAFDEALLMSWFVYEMSVGPGQTLRSAVTAPLYPSIDAGYEPPVCIYEYLLSPAATWAAFGNLSVKIETPFVLLDKEGAQMTFTEADGGYAAEIDRLPKGELIFRLCTDPSPKKTTFLGYSLETLPYILWAVFLFVVLPAAAAAAIVIVVKKRRKKKNKT